MRIPQKKELTRNWLLNSQNVIQTKADSHRSRNQQSTLSFGAFAEITVLGMRIYVWCQLTAIWLMHSESWIVCMNWMRSFRRRSRSKFEKIRGGGDMQMKMANQIACPCIPTWDFLWHVQIWP